MSIEEKHSWIYAVVSFVTYVVYLAVVVPRTHGVPIAEVSYLTPMLWALGVTIGGTILSRILLAIIWQQDEVRSPDERDRAITRFGDQIGFAVGSAGSLAGLILAMTQADYFWIANAIFLGCGLGGFVGSVTKVVVYRRGFVR